jgi:hypothetical protein
MTKEIKIEFAEGCFDNFDGTQEELAEFIADIQNMANNGTLFENSVPVSESDEEEIFKMLAKREKRQ